jgi:poly-gamma-glutamate capsule biosynthesis protein CapA/YwtB (metallophosphatase superfamily)
MRSGKNRKKYRLNLGKFIIFIIAVAVTGIAVLLLWPEELEGPEIIQAPEAEYKTLSVRCVGDIMAHSPQLDAACKKDGTYYRYIDKGNYFMVETDASFDFTDNYEYVKDYLNDCDLAMGNVETTFSGDKSYTGYPGFDSPDDLATDLKTVGFDVALFANNHMLDTKLAGARRTVKVLRNSGLLVAGARREISEDRFVISDATGVKVGIVAYTYETTLVNGFRSMNGSTGTGMNSGAPDYINTFRYYNLDSDKENIAGDIRSCRENGAEIVIVYLHWGNEYQTSPAKDDRKLAEYLAKSGADIIFASHPHVLQKIDKVEVEVPYPESWSSEVYPRFGSIPERTGLQKIKLKLGIIKEPELPQLTQVQRPSMWVKTVPVFYSMGNFISNQRSETLAGVYGADIARKTEQGMIACVNLTYCVDNGGVEYNEVSCIPTWVDKYSVGGKLQYRIVPLIGDFENITSLKSSGHTGRAKAALTEITNLLGEQYIKTK